MVYLNRTGIAMRRSRDESEYHCHPSDFGDCVCKNWSGSPYATRDGMVLYTYKIDAAPKS